METEERIPKLFIRIWLGDNPMPNRFEEWWLGFKKLHPDYSFMTITSEVGFQMSKELENIYWKLGSYSSQSNVLRLLALYKFGGIYMDTDMKPLKPFDHLLEENTPFIGMRSTKSFATGVIGAPKKHPAVKHLIDKLPERYLTHGDSSVVFGPGYVSAEWFGRKDIRHLPVRTFYLYDGFRAPKREERDRLMEEGEFPEEMLAVHYGNHVWGGKPKRKTYENRNDI